MPPGTEIIRTYAEYGNLIDGFFRGCYQLLFIVGRPELAKSYEFEQRLGQASHQGMPLTHATHGTATMPSVATWLLATVNAQWPASCKERPADNAIANVASTVSPAPHTSRAFVALAGKYQMEAKTQLLTYFNGSGTDWINLTYPLCHFR